MKLSIFIAIILGSSFVCFSQRMITDSAFYANGKLMSYGRYDLAGKHWNYYEFYENGQIQRTKILDPINFQNADTCIVYHRNGKVAWLFPYRDSSFLNGKLIGYYQNGSIKREAYYYRNFRTGTWKEYHQNGKLKSISYYAIMPRDSIANIIELTTKDYQNGFAQSETFTWGELSSKTLYDGLLEGQTRFTTTTLISSKTGIWKTYDSSGEVRDKRLTDFENTAIIKNLSEMHGVSLQTLKEIFEKSNSFEELAQMFQENFDGDNMTELFKKWNEFDTDYLEMLNKPRLALGLDRLTFKEQSKGKIQKR
jgi:antitoxin component YwqK of YwqJK toxin-antitoxin module